MPEIFDIGDVTARPIQQNIGEPGVSPQTKGRDIVLNAEDTFNLTASSIARQEQEAADAFRRERDSQRAKEEANTRLGNLTTGLVNRFGELDTRVSNPIERNRLKREAELTALTAAGKENSGYISTIIDKLSTKREARGDGMINVLDSKGNIIGVEAGSRDAVLQGQMKKYQRVVDDVLPNTLDSIGGLLNKDAQEGNFITEQSVSEMINNFKNVSRTMQDTSNQYHVMSNQLPSSQLTALTEKAKTSYFSSINSIFNSFTSEDFLKAVKAGRGMTRSDIDITLQQVRRDVMDEIIQSQVPVNVSDMDTLIDTRIKRIQEAYDSVQRGDNVSLDVLNNKLRLQSEIDKHMLDQKYNTNEVKAAGDMLDFFAKSASVQETITSSGGSSRADKERTKGQLQAVQDLSGSIESKFQAMQVHAQQSAFDLNDFIVGIKDATKPEQISQALNKLSKVTSSPNGWVMLPAVKAAIAEIQPKIIEFTKDGKLPAESVENMYRQLGQYENFSKDMQKKAGESEESWSDGLVGVFTWFKNKVTGMPDVPVSVAPIVRPKALDNTKALTEAVEGLQNQ